LLCRNLASTAAAPASPHSTEIQSLQSALAIPGLAYAIVENGKTIASSAFGVEQGSGRRPFARSTPLRIAAMAIGYRGCAGPRYRSNQSRTSPIRSGRVTRLRWPPSYTM
jgi:hypothetical protein